MCNIKKCPFLTASFKEVIEQITKWQALKFELQKKINFYMSLRKNPIENESYNAGILFATNSIIKMMEEMEKKLK